MNKSKGLLFLAYYFPPLHTIAIWRNYFLASEARSMFENLFVFTTDNNELFKHENVDISFFDITQLSTYDYRSLFNSSKTQSIGFKEEHKQNCYSKIGIKLLNSFPISFIVGEGGLVYILKGYKEAKKLIKSGKISHLYSSYRPMADHWIAYLLKRKYPELHWTADFRDLPIDPLYRYYVWKNFQEKVLRKMLKRADLVCTFAQGIQSGLQEYTDLKVQIIPNGIFQLESNDTKQELQPKFTIQYTGSLFLEERDPGILLQAINELIDNGIIDIKDFSIQYAGKDAIQWQHHIDNYKLAAISHIINETSTAEARILQQKAHLNLLLTSSQPGFTGIFTGKFFELIGSSRPMLVIINGIKDEEFEHVFNKYNLGLLSYNRSGRLEEIKSFISDRYTYWKRTGKSEWEMDKGIVEDFSWKKSVEVWRSLLTKLK